MDNISVKTIAVLLTVLLIGGGAWVIYSNQSDDGETENTRAVVDMRGETIYIPEDPSRVAIIDRGFVAQALVALNVEDKVVATGGLLGANVPPANNTRDTLLLNPAYAELPNFGYPGYLAFSQETLAAANPDLVIWKQTNNGSASPDTVMMMNVINNVLKVPLFVLKEPGYDGTAPSIETNYLSIELLGNIFKKDIRADEINTFLKLKIKEITDRTSSLSESEIPTAMILGLASEGSGAYAYGPNYTHGLYLQEIAGIRNVITDHTNQIISLEGIIKLNPDMLVLVDGPINPNLDTIYNDGRFGSWSVLNAVSSQNVCSVGQLAWWGEHMMNFPSILMIVAKQAHPDLFNDIDLTEWIKEYEMELYDKNDSEALELMYAEKLYWNNLIQGP